MKIRGTVNGQEIETEIDLKQFQKLVQNQNEHPHIHHSKPHPSNNDKGCDGCGKMMRKHYHVCEECFKYMREGFIKRLQQLEKEVAELKKNE